MLYGDDEPEVELLDVHDDLDLVAALLVEANVEFDFVTDERCTTATESSTNWIWHWLPRM